MERLGWAWKNKAKNAAAANAGSRTPSNGAPHGPGAGDGSRLKRTAERATSGRRRGMRGERRREARVGQVAETGISVLPRNQYRDHYAIAPGGEKIGFPLCADAMPRYRYRLMAWRASKACAKVNASGWSCCILPPIATRTLPMTSAGTHVRRTKAPAQFPRV